MEALKGYVFAEITQLNGRKTKIWASTFLRLLCVHNCSAAPPLPWPLVVLRELDPQLQHGSTTQVQGLLLEDHRAGLRSLSYLLGECEQWGQGWSLMQSPDLAAEGDEEGRSRPGTPGLRGNRMCKGLS